MELRHLRSFLAIAEHGHFRRAADSLQLAQSALSRHLQSLETEIGAPLVKRDSRNVVLTPAGEALRSEAAPLVESLDATVARVQRIARDKKEAIRVGCPPYLAERLVAELASERASSFASLQVELREASAGNAIDSVLAGQLDAALVNAKPAHEALLARPLYRERLGVLVGRSHPLAKHPSLRLRELTAERFVLCPRYRSAGFHEVLLKCLHSVGIEPDIAAQTDSSVQTAELVRRGKGVALLPVPVLLDPPKDCIGIPLTDPQAEVEHYVIWSADAVRPAVHRFLKAIDGIGLTLASQGVAPLSAAADRLAFASPACAMPEIED